jgi:hypothetical protein
MTILTNPAFGLLKKHYHFENVLEKADKSVVLATFSFCKRLGYISYIIKPEEWAAVTGGMVIYDSDDLNEYVEPEWFEWTLLYDYEPGWFTIKNTHFSDVNRKHDYGNFNYKQHEPDDFISKSATVRIKKGDRITSPLLCFKGVDMEKFNEHKEQIIIDSNCYTTIFHRPIMIRKEFNCIW